MPLGTVQVAPTPSEVRPMAALREATWASHQRLEKRLDIKKRFSERAAYCEHLRRMWRFCFYLERQVETQAFDGALPDYEKRRKLPLLSRDLAALGAAPPSFAEPVSFPRVSDPAQAFGCAYVLEGATLGGRVMLPVVEDRLGLSAEHGAAFLASYGAEVPAMWQGFSAALNEYCHTPQRCALAVESAIMSFDALTDCLTEALDE
jgi:heme oxygenase (biliverdin-IX-beta and delta-forming)